MLGSDGGGSARPQPKQIVAELTIMMAEDGSINIRHPSNPKMAIGMMLRALDLMCSKHVQDESQVKVVSPLLDLPKSAMGRG